MNKLPITDDLIVDESATIADVIRKLNKNQRQIVCVVDDTRRLLGVVGDGDIRRKLLDGITVNDCVTQVINRRPLTSHEDTSTPEILAFLRHNKISQIPIVDEQGILVGLVTQRTLLEAEVHDNWIVILAGGLGTRLFPLTKDTPKPLLPVNGRPIIEIVTRNFASAGFWKFFVSVNYLGEQIKSHLGDGSQMNVSIKYLDETERTGTAGSLALLPERPDRPFFVMNADILTSIDLEAMLRAHEATRPLITVGSRLYEQTVDFGVLVAVGYADGFRRTSGNRVVRLEEKPVERYQINAGIYVLEPRVLDFIGSGPRFVNMTDVIDYALSSGEVVQSFPIHEYWRDIGRPDDLKQASQEYSEVFRDE